MYSDRPGARSGKGSIVPGLAPLTQRPNSSFIAPKSQNRKQFALEKTAIGNHPEPAEESIRTDKGLLNPPIPYPRQDRIPNLSTSAGLLPDSDKPILIASRFRYTLWKRGSLGEPMSGAVSQQYDLCRNIKIANGSRRSRPPFRVRPDKRWSV